MASRIFRFVILALNALQALSSTHSRFLGNDEAAIRNISIANVEAQLSASLEAVLGGERSLILEQRLDTIEAAMWQTFQAVPKNKLGRLSPVASRHMVHNYFAAAHGWIINGLEPHGMNTNMTHVHQSTILLDKVPRLVEDLLEAKRVGHGLSLTDVVAMAAVLEQLIFDETLVLLETAYSFNGKRTSDLVESEALYDILDSYMLLFEQGTFANLSNPDKHHFIKQRRLKQNTNWHNVRIYVRDTVKNVEYMQQEGVNNMFGPAVFYTFEQASHFADHILQGYGRVQDTECRGMTQALAKLDPLGTGRIPLHVFYSQPHTADYQFKESTYYLQQVGALEERGDVRIANYVQGPSNCMAHSAYYSVCCLVACDGLMRELEGSIRAPQASPEQLLILVRNISSPSVDADRRHLSADLERKLHAIADRHRGAVPLHGRLFAQWMHFAFPQECPFPHVAQDVEVMRPSSWSGNGSGAKVLRETPDERKRLAREGAAVYAALPAGDPLVMEWSEEEILFLEEPQRRYSLVSTSMRLVLQLSMAATIVRIGLAGLRFANPGRAEKTSEYTV